MVEELKLIARSPEGIQQWWDGPTVVDYDPMNHIGWIYTVDGYTTVPLRTGKPTWHQNTSLALSKLQGEQE